MNKKPANGERNAISGYRNQYLIGANIIFNALEKRDLEWIRVADPDMGRVDDFQVATTARVDAYQVKWEQYPGAITYNDITKDNGSAPPLFMQLADGWKRLKKLYTSQRVVVHLVTNQFASSSSKGSMPQNKSQPSPYHFAAFIEQAWKPAQNKGKIDFSGAWESVWREIQKNTGLSVEEFKEFILDCSLDFQASNPKKTDDIKLISDLLLDTVASPERLIELSKDQLITRLGWRERYSFWNVHEFPEPKYTYHPIQRTVKDLKAKIDNLQSGYVGVFGSPGSGKSTLLTQTLRTLPVRLIRYYAYVPDAQDPSAIRGESINFLHDVTLKLSLAGIRGNEPRDPSNRIGMLNYFNEQLSLLGTDYQKTGKKTVLLIDGLDHIDREQHPDRSLLYDLPLPQEIPDGVYIILGSQTDELPDLPPRVFQELKVGNRRVEMGKLTPSDSRALALVAIPDLCKEEIQKIIELSDGHPLALIYLLKEIQQISDSKERIEYLGEAESHKGDIENQYWSHWQKIEGDEEVRYALGLLSRTRGPISIEWVVTWVKTTSVLRKIQKLFLTYFEKDSQDRWIFFHNSFRLFLIARTSEPLPGKTREQQDQALHLELASKYKDSDTPWHWETLYHYFFAEDHQAVIDIATWEWFLQQAMSLRPLDAIQTDIRLALKSAGKCKDIVLLTRLTLIGAAIQQRSSMLEDYPISDLLLRCGKPGLAADHIRDGNRLRVKTEQALILSTELLNAGLKREARQIFELSEPLELLSGQLIPGDVTRPENLRGDLKAWVRSAILFRDAEEIIETIKKIRVSPRWNDTGDIETESRELQDWLFFQGALACCEHNDWDNWESFYTALDSEHGQTLRMFTLLRSLEFVQKHNITERVQHFLPEFLSTYPPAYFKGMDNSQWSIEGRISLAELLSNFDEHKQESKKYIENIDSIPLYDPDLIYDKETLQKEFRFRLSCLRYFLGESQEPRQLLEKAETITSFPQYAEDEEKQGYRQIALATYETARLWAWGKSGNCLSPTAFMQKIKWVIDLFGPRWIDLSIHARMYLMDSRYDILNCVILAAQQHGKQVLNAIKNDFQTRWQDPEEGSKWPSGLQRKLINSFIKAGIDQSWVREQLLRISPVMLNGLDPYGKVEECKLQAETWLLINDRDEALKDLRLMVNAARGIRSEKDYQLSEWVNWLGQINTIESYGRSERTHLMLRRIVSVKDVASGVASSAEDLLRIVFQWSPYRSIKLFKALLESNTIDFKAGLVHILDAALNSVDPPFEEVKQIILNLLIPFLPGSEPDILESLLVTEAKNKGSEKVKETAQILVNRVGTNALSDDRFEWIQGVIRGLKKVGLSESTITIGPTVREENDDHGSSQLDRNLYLDKGEVISSSEALLLINNINDLINILENEDTSKTKHFDWATIAEHLIPQLNTERQLNDIESLISKRLSKEISKETYLGRLHIAISQRYIEFGNLTQAWDHAQQALDISKPSGWVSYWDGGVRLKALRLLNTINPNKTREFIFDLYAVDLSERSYYPESLVPHLYEILKALSNEIPTSQIWAEIEYYLDDLFVSVDVEEAEDLEYTLDDFSDLPKNDNPKLAMIKILILCLAYPAYPIAQGAVTGLTELLVDEREQSIDVINFVMSSNNDLLIERFLMVLDALSLNHKQAPILNAFNSKIGELCFSPNFSIRLTACKVASHIKNSPLMIGSNNTQLPPIYELQLPEVSLHKTWQTMKGEQSPILVGDLASRISPYDEELRIIARMATLPVDNTLYRAVHYFEAFLNNRIWLGDGKTLTERRLVAFLENTGVRTSHTKPHIFAARQALAYVIAELWDCGYLRMDNIETYQMMLSNYDPDLIIKKPSERPVYIAPIGDQTKRSSFERIPDNWVGNPKESIPLMTRITDDNQIIIGESTELKYLQDDWPTEIRYSVVKGKEAENFWEDLGTDMNFPPFYRNMNGLIQRYPHISAPLEHLVISNSALGFETAGTNWLALNPFLGNELGWKLASEGLFSWIDGSGNIVARSVWWRDGSIELYTRFERVEVAEGWLVLISKSGLDEIKRILTTLNRGIVINRRIGWLGDKGSQTAREITTIY